jgi:16S rRNA processing protein RimM
VAAEPTRVLAVGRVRRPHGVHGEILADVTTDFPERVVSGIEVGLGASAPERWVRLESVRFHKGCFLIRLEGVSSRDAVEGLRNWWLFLPEQERSQLPPNYYYEHELSGLSCVRRDGSVVGVVGELGSGTGTAMLTVRTGATEVLVPFISPIVVEVDLVGRRVVIDPPDGLFDVDAL